VAVRLVLLSVCSENLCPFPHAFFLKLSVRDLVCASRAVLAQSDPPLLTLPSGRKGFCFFFYWFPLFGLFRLLVLFSGYRQAFPALPPSLLIVSPQPGFFFFLPFSPQCDDFFGMWFVSSRPEQLFFFLNRSAPLRGSVSNSPTQCQALSPRAFRCSANRFFPFQLHTTHIFILRIIVCHVFVLSPVCHSLSSLASFVKGRSQTVPLRSFRKRLFCDLCFPVSPLLRAFPKRFFRPA